MNKIEQMNCHVLFKQVHTMLCICTLEKMRSQIWWMDEFGILRPFQQYFSHIGTMEGRTWKALCNEVPSMFGKNLSSSGIRTRDPVVRSWDRSEAKSEAYYLFSNLTRGSYGNRQNVPRIKTEQYSKYIFNINPLAFFLWNLKKERLWQDSIPGPLDC